MGNLKRKRKHIEEEKYIHFKRKDIYAICYASERVIYYNLDFDGPTEIYFLVSNIEAISNNRGRSI